MLRGYALLQGWMLMPDIDLHNDQGMSVKGRRVKSKLYRKPKAYIGGALKRWSGESRRERDARKREARIVRDERSWMG